MSNSLEVKMNNQEVQVKADDKILKGRYANIMYIAHTKEEFVLDFLNIFPPQGTLVSRVITSPGHMKRILKALEENIKQYEDKFGSIEVAPEPKKGVGFHA